MTWRCLLCIIIVHSQLMMCSDNWATLDNQCCHCSWTFLEMANMGEQLSEKRPSQNNKVANKVQNINIGVIKLYEVNK